MAACTLCGADDSGAVAIPPTVFDGHTFRYLRCGACGCTFVHPRPSEETLLRIYPTAYQAEDNPAAGARHEADLAVVGRFLAPGARILDYGCGTGALVAAGRRAGYAMDGAEFNPAHVDVLRAAHPAARFLDVQAVGTVDGDAYDALVLNNVLEHLTNPYETLAGLLRLLTKGGLVFCFGPLEKNPSVVHAAVALNYSLKTWWDPEACSSHPPTHLTFTSASVQRAFFRRARLDEVLFEVDDNAWPYPKDLSTAVGAVAKLKWVIGLTSRMTSALVPSLGNAFTYVGRVRP